MHLPGKNETAVQTLGIKKTDNPSTLWKSFWDLADPEIVSNALTELYGAGAARAATDCAAAAIADGREDDYRFWIAARCCIDATQARTRQEAVARWEANGLCFI